MGWAGKQPGTMKWYQVAENQTKMEGSLNGAYVSLRTQD
jgi:hypothetical protein